LSRKECFAQQQTCNKCGSERDKRDNQGRHGWKPVWGTCDWAINQSPTVKSSKGFNYEVDHAFRDQYPGL